EKFHSSSSSALYHSKQPSVQTPINVARSSSSPFPNATNNIPMFNSQIQFLQQLQSHDTRANSANRNPFMKFIDYSNPVLVTNESQQPINLTTSADSPKEKGE
ncbi:hypothetical protein FHG87_013508, partial [Trinorchestia longiramus]